MAKTENDLTVEQWKTIAEKLAKYLKIACNVYPTIEECHNKCLIQCEFAIVWI